MSQTYRKEEGTFLSHDGIHKIAYTVYTPDVPPHAILQIAHGMAEHFGRYDEFAAFLAQKGIVVCGNDHLGHGNSVVDESELGFFGEKNGIDHVLGDMHALQTKLREKYPRLPYILFGHSMGSFFARLYSVTYPDDLAGAIYCGTSAGNEPLGLATLLAKIIGLFRGKKYRSKLLQKLSTGSYDKRFVGQPGNWLTKDVSVLQRDAATPRLGFAFTAAGYRDLFDLLSRVSDEAWAKRVPRSLPILLVSGSDDPVGSFGEGVRAVYERLRDVEISDLTLKLYPGDRHEVLNEIDRAQVYEDLFAWVEDVCRGVAAANGVPAR